MYVHLGGTAVVDVREVVAVLDARRMRVAEARALLARAGPRVAGGGVGSTEGRLRAIVVTTTGVYRVPVTAATVAKRLAHAGRPRRRRTAGT